MGSGITTQAFQTNHFVTSVIKVLQSDRSSSAFLKYLERNGKGCLLTLYLDICQYRCTNNEHGLQQVLKKIRSCRQQHPLDSNPSWRQELYDMITEILLTQLITPVDVKKLENLCVLQLSNELPEFMASHEHLVMSIEEDIEKQEPKYRNFRKEGGISKELKNKYKNILIIDDSPQNSRIMSHALKANGHSVRQANHGWIGTHIATLHHFDVILIDLAMSSMDPYEVIKLIKASNSKHAPSILVIGLKYSEYDSALKSQDIMYRINVGTLSTSNVSKISTTKFMADVNSTIIKYEGMLKNLDNNDGCHTSYTCNTTSYTCNTTSYTATSESIKSVVLILPNDISPRINNVTHVD